MIVYIILIFLVLVLNLFCRNTLFASIFLGVLMIFIAATKALTVGSDTYNYYIAFVNVESLYYLRTFAGTQILWYYFNVFCCEYLNYDIFQFLCYSIIIYGFFYSFQKESAYPLFSILVFILMYFYFSSFNVMRQYIAISIVLLAYIQLLSRKYVVFLLFVLLASCFHFSALLALISWFLYKIRLPNNIYVYGGVVLSFVVGFFYTDKLTDMITSIVIDKDSDIMGYEQYLYFFGTGRNLLANLISNMVFVALYYLTRDKNDFFLKMYLVATVLDNLFGSAGHASRFILYFKMSVLFVFPNVLKDMHSIRLRSFYLTFIILYMFSVFSARFLLNESDVMPYKSSLF